jgi:hypothetical protein
MLWSHNRLLYRAIFVMKSILFVVFLRFCPFSFLFVKVTYSTSSSSRYCQRNKSYVQSHCQCNTYQQLNCIPPSGCAYHGEGGGYRITNGEDSSSSGSNRRYDGGRGLNIKTSRNDALQRLLGTGESNRGLCSTNWDSKCECCCGKQTHQFFSSFLTYDCLNTALSHHKLKLFPLHMTPDAFALPRLT